MNNISKALLATIGGVVLVVLIAVSVLGLTYISWSNQEIDIAVSVNAGIDVNKAVFDKTWKTVQQKAGVTDQYKQVFTEAYPLLMSERYKEGEAQLAKIVTESNPTFDVSLYKDLMTAIESNRAEFLANQKDLIAKNQEHTALITKFPGSFFNFFAGRKLIIVPVVTSTRTEKAFATGKDDNVDLFSKPSPVPTVTPTPAPKKKAVDQNGLRKLPVVIPTK